MANDIEEHNTVGSTALSQMTEQTGYTSTYKGVWAVLHSLFVRSPVPNSIDGMILRFRQRARALSLFANIAVIGAVFVLLAGLYAFVFFKSSEVAANDFQSINKRRESVVEELAKSYTDIRSLELQVLAQKSVAGSAKGDLDSTETDIMGLYEGKSNEYKADVAKLKNIADEEMAKLEALQSQLDVAQATRDLLRPSNANTTAQQEISRNDVVFTITANITRMGAVIVVVFFAQMFLAIYRYTMRLAAYYDARADVVELVTKHGLSDGVNYSDAIVKLLPVLSPDGVDFHRPNSPSEDLMKLAATLKEFRG